MITDQWQKAKELLVAALEYPPDERLRFVDENCNGDEAVRREVESLLANSDDASVFLEQPAIGEVAEAIVENKEKLQVSKNFGHYKIIKTLGTGGMGEVFLANDTKLDRRVAIKILNEEFSRDETNLGRFVREAKAASALNHPNILVIHEIGETEDARYIVSEFIEGKTLREIINGSPMNVSEVLDIAIQTAGALTAAHGAHIVHRDIKPENIMVRPDGYVKILDFGLAKLIEQKNRSLIGLEDKTAKQNNTAKGVILGTVSYMSPEQAKGEQVDGRTDIFSFGILMYEMIAGRVPFAGDSVSEAFANLINKDPQPLSRFAANVPDELQRIVAKMLRKNKDARYQTMKGLLADLMELKENLAFEAKLERTAAPLAANGEAKTAIIAERPTAKQTGQFRRRFSARRGVIYAAVLITLILGAGIYVWQWRQTSVTSQSEIKSLAVLPLKSLDAGENYLGLGIADAVIRRINQTGQMIVRPTSAVRRYLNEDTDALTAARQLNADAVLEGSVQRADDRLRVSVNLLRASDGASLWADSFDMRATDIFTIQDTVAQQVASRLRLQLDPSQQARLTKRSTSNPVAYEFYVKGVYSFDQNLRGSRSKPHMEVTIDLFKKATEADPNFALAYAHLAYSYAAMAIFIEPTEPVWVDRAKDEIDRAQTLDPQLAEIHLTRSLLLWSSYEGYQIEAACRELLLAQQLNPNVGRVELGGLYSHMGLEDLAARELQRALEIDPTSEFAKDLSLYQYQMNGRYDEWLAAHNRLYPNDSISGWYFLGKGSLKEAQKAIEELSEKIPDDIELPREKALLLALKGEFSSAEAMIPPILSKHHLKDLNYHHATYDIACIYALEGKSVEAVKWLRETAVTGFQPYPMFERDAYLNRIRKAPEFVQFMTEMKSLNEKYRNEFK